MDSAAGATRRWTGLPPAARDRPYVADFYCSAARLVIEVDGAVHTEDAQIAHDERRDAYMRELGYEVLRVPAGEIMRDADEAADGVVQAALSLIRKAR